MLIASPTCAKNAFILIRVSPGGTPAASGPRAYFSFFAVTWFAG
jgi:hypothetical protein